MRIPTLTALALTALALTLTGCSRGSVESGAVLAPHTSAQLDIRSPSSSELFVRNSTDRPLAVAITSGPSMPATTDTIAPGVTRWWNPDGPRTFWFTNDSDVPLPFDYRVVAAATDIQFTMPATKP